MVQGINKEYIFKDERYINRYIQLMKRNLEGKDLEIIAFCIMNNHAHLLMKVENIKELSEYMRKVNGTYAKYYNYMEKERVGYVFRDRYKSEPIMEKGQLIQCVKYIHQNPVKANMVKDAREYKYSSYNQYRNKIERYNMKKEQIFTKEELEFICNSNTYCYEQFLDININIEEKINNAISEFIKKENKKVFEIFQKDDILKKLIRYLKSQKNIKYTDIMRRLDITKGTMERLKK